MLFEEGIISPLHVFYKIKYPYYGYRNKITIKVSRQIGQLQLDKSKPWGFLMVVHKVTQGNLGRAKFCMSQSPTSPSHVREGMASITWKR
jgi:hypothetical protein